jgi:hypothetical protein
MAQNRIVYVAVILAIAIVVAIVLFVTHIPSSSH